MAEALEATFDSTDGGVLGRFARTELAAEAAEHEESPEDAEGENRVGLEAEMVETESYVREEEKPEEREDQEVLEDGEETNENQE